MVDMVLTALVATLAAFLSLVAALALSRMLEPGHRRRAGRLEQRIAPTAFLFRGEHLIDATPPAKILLGRLPEPRRRALLAWLDARLPGTLAAIDRLGCEGRVQIAGGEGRGSARLTLLLEDLGDSLMRLTLSDPTAESAGIVVDSLSQAALEDEVSALREIADCAPMLSWRQGPDGHIHWANAAYLAEAEAHSQAGGPPLWPLPQLLELPAPGWINGDGLPADPAAADGRRLPPRPYRARLETVGGGRWFDCHVRRHGVDMVVFALPADDAVRAERSLREFVQTLTKTFADLPIGLAIFDSQRQLQLFNPALIDLTGLQTSFLTARPSLFSFLDRMREGRMVPEPRDYRSWRRQMSTLEAAAASGHHVETWSLPGGQTYRVTGRPHPDGALAFLFEDITSEMSLTRRFRAQLSLGTMVVDALDEALGVFGADGQMVMGNEAWRRLWGDLPLVLAERLRSLEARTGPSAGLARLIGHLDGDSHREQAAGAMGGPDGGLLSWRVTPLPGGQVMVGFSAGPGQQPAVPVEAAGDGAGLPARGLGGKPPGLTVPSAAAVS